MKRIVLGMSVSKSKLESRMESLSDKVTVHLLKCVIYGDSTGNYEHWIAELTNWISIVNDMTVKPRDKKLKPASYETYLFGGIGKDEADARLNLEWWLAEVQKTNKYPKFFISSKLESAVRNMSSEIIDTFVPVLSSKNNLTSEDIRKALHAILDAYCQEA